ncbi:hypothetical protein PVK06_011280 [Gossypium arboreum]|uniref:Uncharacterized protein n=1 Tax=Gossypium arboreum TaxID=29729 RepID=A0ABR0Q8H9_GOSAR|nr:hypothetical protein PVK06_011280 [Gossypium arboreum]
MVEKEALSKLARANPPTEDMDLKTLTPSPKTLMPETMPTMTSNRVQEIGK